MTRKRLSIVALAAFTQAGLLFSMEDLTVAAAQVEHLSLPPASPGNTSHVVNRPPQIPNRLIKLAPGAVTPHGWLRTQLERMRDGQIGRLPEISKWCDFDKSAWANPTGEGEFGWEELPYWLRGFTELAYVLRDEKLMAEVNKWVDAILASQREDGYFGPQSNLERLDVWPNMLVLNVLQTHYEATGDERVLPFLTRYFRWQFNLKQEELLPGSWQKVRAGDNLESVLWLYNRTGEDWLLDLARRIHERTIRWDLKVANWHGVNICQGYREPGVFYPVTGDRGLLDAAERNYQTVMTLYGQVPGGMFGADENCREGYNGPRQAAETCSMVEFMHSFEMLLAISGDPVQADRCEEVALNDLPAALTPDHKGLHYLTAPNMIQLDESNKAPGLQNSGCMLAFSPHRYRCCQHNAGMGWPQFAEHLWMATQDNGLALIQYAASSVTTTAGDGVEVTAAVETDFPFDEQVVVTVHPKQAAEFPIYLRVPGWCHKPVVAVNGQTLSGQGAGPGYLRVLRKWSPGDKLTLQLPMAVDVTTWRTHRDAVSVRRGPLWYSLKIGERWEREGGTDEWPEFAVYPTTPWNYGLVLDEHAPAQSFKFVNRDGKLAEQPFAPETVPVALQASARRIPQWQPEPNGLVGELQGSPVASDAPVETVTLIPMGAARLRISVFPVIGEGPDAYHWKEAALPRHEASEVWDVIYALSDGEIPNSSYDYSTPRFTWVPQKGTTEWVTYRFDAPRKVSWSDVYWFSEAGDNYCRPPASWKLYYRAGDAWKEVSGASEYGVKLDQFNRVTFNPVETTQLKLEVQLQPERSAGILEWRVGEE